MRDTSVEEIVALYRARGFRTGEGMLLRSLYAQLGYPRGESFKRVVDVAVATGQFCLSSNGDWLMLA